MAIRRWPKESMPRLHSQFLPCFAILPPDGDFLQCFEIDSAIEAGLSKTPFCMSKYAVQKAVIPEVVIGNPAFRNPWVPDNNLGNDDI